MKLPHMNEFSANNFPLKISKAIHYTKYKTQAPESLICASVLNAMAYSCQGNINIEDHSIKPVSINSIILSESGERKSTVDKMFSQPILDLEKELTQEFESEQIKYESDMELWKLENEHYKKSHLKSKQNNDNNADEWRKKYQESHQLKPQKPKKKKLIVDDTTIEALHDAFANGSDSIWLTSNEGGTITNGRIFNAFPTLNKYFDGQPISVERKSAPSYTINDARLCISLMIQYGIFKKMLEKHGDELRNSGFFARTLICNPTSTQGSRIKVNCSFKHFDTRLHDEMLQSSYIEFIERTRELIKEHHERCKNKEEKTVLKFDQDAQMLWDQQYNQVEQHLNPGGVFYNFKDIASRYMEQVSRVAAILQYFTTGEKLINSDIMCKAISIVDYYAFQFMNIFKEEEETPESINNAEVLYQWIRLRLDSLPRGTSIPKNHIRKYGPTCIRDKNKLNEAINLLIQQYRINVTKSNHQRPTIYIDLNVTL